MTSSLFVCNIRMRKDLSISLIKVSVLPQFHELPLSCNLLPLVREMFTMRISVLIPAATFVFLVDKLQLISDKFF